MPSLGSFTPPCIPGINWRKPCSACPRLFSPIPGDGILPPPVPYRRIFAIGERPGPDEYKRSGRPFTGKSGQELNENYLYLAGLSREDIYLCNTVRCGAEGNRTPNKTEIAACARHFLPYELDAVRPHFILLLGGVACSLFDDSDPISLQLHHGRPLRRRLYGRDYWVIPMFHPALGMHDTRKMTPILQDWETAGKIIKGDYRIPSDQFAGREDYRLATMAEEVHAYFTQYADLQNGYGITQYGGLDTETDAGKMWCITVSVAPGSGLMVRVSDTEAMHALYAYIRLFHWFIHNAGFDVDILAHARDPLILPPHRFTCTQQAVYHRGNLPQGLKALGYRIFGLSMTSYEDTVLPWSRKKLMGWWVDALLLTGSDRVEVPGAISVKTGRHGKSKFKPSRAYSRLLQIYNYSQANPEYDPWKSWDSLGVADKKDPDKEVKVTEEDKVRIIGEIGEPPRQSIVHVPVEIARDYAIRDCDVGLRLGLYLRKDEKGFRKREGFKR